MRSQSVPIRSHNKLAAVAVDLLLLLLNVLLTFLFRRVPSRSDSTFAITTDWPFVSTFRRIVDRNFFVDGTESIFVEAFITQCGSVAN